MFGDCTRHLSKLWIVLNKSLPIKDRFYNNTVRGFDAILASAILGIQGEGRGGGELGEGKVATLPSVTPSNCYDKVLA